MVSLARKRRKKKWIQKLKRGTLTRAAKRSGKSISAFCAQKNLSTVNKRRCAAARTLRKLRKRKRKR